MFILPSLYEKGVLLSYISRAERKPRANSLIGEQPRDIREQSDNSKVQTDLQGKSNFGGFHLITLGIYLSSVASQRLFRKYVVPALHGTGASYI